MVLKIKNKIALITGGASGIGLSLAKELLKNGAKGVTLADINLENGEQVTKDINNKFGPNKAIFVKTDVTDENSFENAFKATVGNFKYIDMLFNNAGISDEVQWEKTIDVNLKAVITGLLLAHENYIKNYKQDEGLIVNMASVAGITPLPPNAVYTATKFGVVGLTKAWGHKWRYGPSNIRVLGVLPGFTDTPILKTNPSHTLRRGDNKLMKDFWTIMKPELQSADYLAQQTMSVIEKGKSGSLWIIESNKPAQEFHLAPYTINSK